ncbi:MAG: cobyric acid synthase [Candidatus Wukongarchaeota archaeon]|nr:cobyric acid synthase [Candidatus Wukongarchaeota archaeon]MDO8128029.1 cobyric acid synthase [Candidatus Wukongarchaeota archaeon]
MEKACSLMFQSTLTHSGKSLFTAAFCRIYSKMGYNVAPFKAQNLSLNSFVTANGREIAVAQAFQAMACNIEPAEMMNPILLKPKGGEKVQIILFGKPYQDMSFPDYRKYFAIKEGFPRIREALKDLLNRYDMVIIEGAGAPSEINLMKSDISNMRVAQIFDSPVLMIGDIDPGGVFAGLIGTLELLRYPEKKLIKGFIINKFRGDQKILEPGIKYLEKRTKKRVLGVVPYIEDLVLPAEDSITLNITRFNPQKRNTKKTNSNLDDVRKVWLQNLDKFCNIVGETIDFDYVDQLLGV